MRIHHGPDDPTPSWRTPAAYFYALDLDGPALAWEYLRRHHEYRACWFHRKRHPHEVAQRWGLRGLEDPGIDARRAQPVWAIALDTLLHVRVSRTPDAANCRPFRFWDIPGRKRVVHHGRDLMMTTVAGSHRMRVALAHDLDDGAPCHCTVPLNSRLRRRLEQFQAQADAVAGRAPTPTPARRADRASVLHLRALQALDAAQAGASHHDIAEAVFGADAAHSRWHADSELRAQVRHLLSRADGLMRSGYLALAGVRQTPASIPGDETGT